MTEPDDSLSEDELPALPSLATPSRLSRLWAICSRLRHQHETDGLDHEPDALPHTIFPWTSPRQKRHRDQLEYEQAMRQIGERQDRLLLCIGDEQRKIEECGKDIEDNALRLRDGRRVYLDGDRYREEAGRGLAGVDEAEAARQHEYRQDVSTWRQKQDVDRRADENQKLKDKILKIREDGQGTPEQAAQSLDGYEKEFAEKMQPRQEAASGGNLREEALHGAAAGAGNTQSVTDHGAADYMNAFGGGYRISAVPAFTAAASGVSREAIRKLSGGDSGSQTADMNNTPRHSGQGAPKLRV